MMFSWIRRRATYANVAMTLALVFAMTGGAYAAKKYLITSTKQISPGVLKSLVGKAGAAGPQGPAGAAAPQGAAGAAGPQGAAGKDGAQGKDGATGPAGPAGATGPAGAKGATGATGPAGTTGPKGANGQTGFTETLPKGKTETGSWGVPIGSPAFTPSTVSFAIPLAAGLGFTHVVYVPQGEEPTTGGCAGGTSEKPLAEEGFMCVYDAWGEVVGGVVAEKSGGQSLGTSVTGAFLLTLGEAKVKENETVHVVGGTWAVTAP